MSGFQGDPNYNILKDKDDYEKIFGEFFGLDKVINRYRHLLNLCNEFFTNNPNLKGKVILQTGSLRAVLHAYFREVIKVKVFHKNIQSVDEAKIYAYVAYWFVRRSPFQIIKPHSDLKDVNIQFAVSYFVNHLCAECGISTQGNKKVGKFMQDMFYYLKARAYNPHSMELIAEAFMLSVKKP